MDNQFYQPGTGVPQPPMPTAPGGPGIQMPGAPVNGMPQSGYPQGGVPYAGNVPQGMPMQGVPTPSAIPNATGAMPLPQGYAQALQAQMGWQTPPAAPGQPGAQIPMNQTGMQPPVGVQPPQAGPAMPGPGVPQGTASYPTYQQAPYGAGYEHLFDYSQQPGGEEPPSGFPPQHYQPPKKKFPVALVCIVLLVAALVAGGVLLVGKAGSGRASVGTITAGTLSASHAGDCLIVRDEAPHDAEGVTSVTYIAEEGARVVRKNEICNVYSSGYSTREVRTLQEYRTEIRDYQKKLIEGETVADARMNRVTGDVLTLVREVRDMISGARGSLANQEVLLTKAMEERQKYLKEKYAEDQRYSRLYDDELSQTQRIDSWTNKEVATEAGIVSFYSDGYEYGLNAHNYTTFEPADVRAMINGRKPELTTAQKGRTTIYRMIEDGEWYVLFLSRDTTWNPVNGQTYRLQLERSERTVVDATVVSFTRSGGELLVRLKISGGVDQVLYMRTCEGVLAEHLATLAVDERAIYVQDGMTGVVVVENGDQSFIPVNVIRYGEGNAYFQPIQQDLLFENMTVRLF